MTTYVMKVLIAVDQLANAVRGGHPDETLSAAAHRRHLEGRSGWRNVINAQLERDQYGNLVKAAQIERDAE